MTYGIEVNALAIRYGCDTAIQDVSLKLEGGKIYGLLGRNGSGKTSLLSALSSYRLPSEGEVRIDGEAAFENARIMSSVCFIQENGYMTDSSSVKEALKLASICWPNWDGDYASRLVEMFRLPLKKRISSLSRGQKSAFGVTIGLASRAPVTILD